MHWHEASQRGGFHLLGEGAVGIAVTGYPPRRSGRALLTHPAPTSGTGVETMHKVPLLQFPARPADVTSHFPGSASGCGRTVGCSPQSRAFPPSIPPHCYMFCSLISPVLCPCPTSCTPRYLVFTLWHHGPLSRIWFRISQVPYDELLHMHRVSDPGRHGACLAISARPLLVSASLNSITASDFMYFVAQYRACGYLR